MCDERPADATPQELDEGRAKRFAARVDALTEALGDALDRFEEDHPDWFTEVLLQLLCEGLLQLRECIEDPADETVSWSSPFVELQYPVPWDWEAEGAAANLGRLTFFRVTATELEAAEAAADARHELASRMTLAAVEVPRLFVLRNLTNECGWIVRDGVQYPLLPASDEDPEEDLLGYVRALPADEQDAAVAKLLQPYCIGPPRWWERPSLDQLRATLEAAGADPDAVAELREEDVDELEAELQADAEAALDAPAITFNLDRDGHHSTVSVVAAVYPFMVDEAERRAYHPLVVGLLCEGEDGNPETWPDEDRNSLWELLLAALEDEQEPAEEAEAGPWKQEPYQPPTGTRKTRTGTAEPPVVVAPPPERRPVPMEPFPYPRAVLGEWAPGALRAGMGPLVAGYRRIPHLDREGDTALTSASRSFWETLEQRLDQASTEYGPPVRWERQDAEAKVQLVLHGLDEATARRLWREVEEALNAGSGGPGVRVEEPGFEERRSFVDGAVRVVTRLTLWPDERYRDGRGDPRPPVRFRKVSSPGYQALLDEQGGRPYFADGWVWQALPDGNREGFRIGGLPDLLYPEGRAAVVQLVERQAATYEAELRRLVADPNLRLPAFAEEDQGLRMELEAGLRRVRRQVERLTTYDWLETALLVFEAFAHQRDAWAREELELPDGRRVSTKPYGRFLRLDADVMRARLDPGQTWGQNWRGRTLDRLEALATFERRVETRKGERVDVGDRLLLRVLDAYRRPDGDGAAAWDALKGLEAFRDNAFYVQPSYATLERLVVFEEGPDGSYHWGQDAAKAAAAKAEAEGRPKAEVARARKEVSDKARARPYVKGSPRLMTLGNLRGWPVTRKHLAHQLLAELTPNRDGRTKRRNRLGGNELLRSFEGRDYLACNGSRDNGYRVTTWLDKVGYARRPGRGGGTKALADFVGDLAALCDPSGLAVVPELVVGGNGGEPVLREDALGYLRRYLNNPRAVYDAVLRLYLPADFEDDLRAKLEAAGVGAAADPPRTRVTPTATGHSPSDFRAARMRAGWTQAELADRLGVTRLVVNQWENATRPIPEERAAQLEELLRDYL